MFKNFGLIVSPIIGLFLIGTAACPQALGVPDEDGILAQTQLEHVDIDAQSIGQLFSDLSLAYNIPIGVEAALNDDELATYQLNFRRVTLSDLLTSFVARHGEYAWQIKNGVVRVFPSKDHRDAILVKLLTTEIRSLVVAENTSCSALERSLFSSSEVTQLLHANGVSYRERNFTGFYLPQLGRKFTLRASNETVESILNQIVRESPSAKFWFLTRSRHDHMVLLTLNARQEAVQQNSIR